jgi:hypothetical protein
MAFLEQGAMAGMITPEFLLLLLRAWFFALPAGVSFVLAVAAVYVLATVVRKRVRVRRFRAKYRNEMEEKSRGC